MAINKLTDSQIKGAEVRGKLYKLMDGGGLQVWVYPGGKKVFRYKFMFNGKEQALTLGNYPFTTLAKARELAFEAKRQVAGGINPAAAKREAKKQAKVAGKTFAMVADEWFNLRKVEWSDSHSKDTEQKLNTHVLPRIGHIPVAEVGRDDIKAILDSLHNQAKYATLKKVRSIVSQILQHAMDMELPGVTQDWTERLRRQYPGQQVKHRAAITEPKQVGELMRAINGYRETSLITTLALKFSALTFCRPGEIRRAQWNEIDRESRLWRIPPEKMKSGQPHLVPLAQQALQLLEELHPVTGHGRYLYPSNRSRQRPMSENTVTAALRRMGYGKDEMCAHGFRGMASSILNEKGCNRDWIERQLAHGPRDKVRASYNHTDYLEGRRAMMQDWADFLDEMQKK